MMSDNLGRNIKHYRKLAGYKQNELAEKLNISTTFLGHVEQGRDYPSLETLIEIADILKLPLDFFICDDIKDSQIFNGNFANKLKELNDDELQKTYDILKNTYEYLYVKNNVADFDEAQN